MTIIQYVISRFGGVERFSELTGAKKNTARWWRYYAKRFTGRWMPVIAQVAKENNIHLSAEEVVKCAAGGDKDNAE